MDSIQRSFLDNKHCPRCDRTLPLTAFYLSKHRPDGRRTWCIECQKSYDLSKKALWAENARVRLQTEGGHTCPHCHVWKPISEYGVNAGSKSGIQVYCQECRYPATRITILKKHKEKYWDDPETYRLKKRSDHHNHRSERNAKRLLYRAEHIEHEKSRVNQWFKDNPDRARFHAKNSVHRRRTWKASAKIHFRDWRAMCAWFGSVCLCCEQPIKLTMDHVQPLSRGGAHSIENVQPLCMDCNHHKFTKSTDYRAPDRLAQFLASIGH